MIGAVSDGGGASWGADRDGGPDRTAKVCILMHSRNNNVSLDLAKLKLQKLRCHLPRAKTVIARDRLQRALEASFVSLFVRGGFDSAD